MRYIGNASLSEQIQERILTTFQQTLSLAQEGNRQEALLGCDFVLRLDPLFEPARQLQTRLSSGEGPVDVGDLAQTVNGDSPEAAVEGAPGPPTASGVEPDLELIEEPASEAPAPAGDDLPGRMALLLEQRSFEELRALATEHQERVAADPSLKQIVETGVERLEAQPYVESFIESSEEAQKIGDLEQAQAHIDKARELDPTHPRILARQADLAQSASTTVEETRDEPAADDGPEAIDISDDSDWLKELETSSDPSATEAVTEPAAEPASDAIDVDLFATDESEPEAQLDSESEDRISKLLEEGQQAFEKSEYQTAIDAWSRIFLIDIDHAEASRRIELARKLKAEIERQVEEAFHEAIQLIESGKKDEAREAFEKVLGMHPGHMGAREYLERIDSGQAAGGGADTATDAIPTLEPIDEVEADESEAGTAPALDELDLAPDLAPEPEPAAAAPPVDLDFEVSAAGGPRKRSSFTVIAGAVLVLVLVIGWLLYSKRHSIFPNSDTETQQAQPPRLDPIERARELHEEGKTVMAINVLRRLPPNHPKYAEGQSLIEAWEIIDTPAPVVDAGPSEDELLRRDELLEQASTATQRGENLVALDLLERANAILPLEDEALEMQALATDSVEDLADEIELFEQGDWEYALPSLWRLHEADKSNRDVNRLMVDAYYNLGLRDLQRGDSRDAAEKFQEALALDPNDEGLLRLSEFAQAYSQRPSDLLYKIFVKYHPFR